VLVGAGVLTNILRRRGQSRLTASAQIAPSDGELRDSGNIDPREDW